MTLEQLITSYIPVEDRATFSHEIKLWFSNRCKEVETSYHVSNENTEDLNKCVFEGRLINSILDEMILNYERKIKECENQFKDQQNKNQLL